MQKTILLTGSTDGIGLETARMLISLGHLVLLHGRNPAKLEKVEKTLSALPDGGHVESYMADLSRMADAEALAKAVAEKHAQLDVLVAGEPLDADDARLAHGDAKLSALTLVCAAEAAFDRFWDALICHGRSPEADAVPLG